MIKLTPDDDEVWTRTMAAVRASSKPTLTIKCKRCGSLLANAGRVDDYGPLFTSSWQEPQTSDVLLNDEAITRRAFIAAAERRGGEVIEQGDTDATQGVVALLALPPETTQDYPDLLVRCARHGDLVLNRLDVLRWLDKGGSVKVTPEGERFEYAPPRVDVDGPSTTQRTTIVVGRGHGMPLDELKQKLRRSTP